MEPDLYTGSATLVACPALGFATCCSDVSLSERMKLNKFVSSDRSKQRKRQLSAPSHIRRRLMSAPLSKVSSFYNKLM